jgi:FlaA1/EpsC-like NDP-sugar epimerase
MNLIDASIDQKVKRVVALSTDKASSPVNIYGASKLASDKLFVSGNSYTGNKDTSFAVVRYGNVMGSRGSVIPLFKSLKEKNKFPITDERMTRFMITLEEGVDLVWKSFDEMIGGEIFVKKIPSMNILDIARAFSDKPEFYDIGIRPGEKLHEQMIGIEDSPYTFEYGDYFKILPSIHNWHTDPDRISSGEKVNEGFKYISNENTEWMSVETLKAWIESN